MYLTHGPWNHVGMISGPGTMHEAVPDGVGHYPLKKYFDGHNYLLLLRLPLTSDQETRSKRLHGRLRRPWICLWDGFRLLLLTLVNEHADYRFRFTIDILVTLGLLAMVPFTFTRIALAIVVGVYLFVLAVHSSTDCEQACACTETTLNMAPQSIVLRSIRLRTDCFGW